MKKNYYRQCFLGFLLSSGIAFNACEEGALVSNPPDWNFEAPAALQNVSTSHGAHYYDKIFDGGTEGHHSYRIPSIVRTPDGTLIAFAEGRKDSDGDYGNINLVYKRSFDNGNTWTSLQVLEGQGPGKFGNPVAVTDFESGKVWIFFMWNSDAFTKNSDFTLWGQRKTYARYSTDNGQTWEPKVDLTASVLPPDYTFDMIGPGIGIQTVQSNPGRLIIPALKRNIYSDDNGTNWQYQAIPSGTSESTIVELYDGSLMRNDRARSSLCDGWRHVSTGTIENGFTSFSADDELVCPCAEASVLRYTYNAVDRILFLNSNSTSSRLRMYVRISYDGGNSWPVEKKVFDWLTDKQCKSQGKGGYSSMIKTADNKVGALIENNENVDDSNSHKSIEFHKFSLSWILNGTPEPAN